MPKGWVEIGRVRNHVHYSGSNPRCKHRKPIDNAFVESFNGTFLAECLDTSWIQTLDVAKQMIHAWRSEYNEGGLTGLWPTGHLRNSSARSRLTEIWLKPPKSRFLNL
jgi:hypothetical protein